MKLNITDTELKIDKSLSTNLKVLGVIIFLIIVVTIQVYIENSFSNNDENIYIEENVNKTGN